MGAQLMSHSTYFEVMFNLNGRVIYCNGHFVRLTGLSLDDVLGRTWEALFVSPWAADSQIPFSDWFKRKVKIMVHESEVVSQAGERFRVRWNTIPLRHTSGTMIGVASIGEDVNEKRRLEGELLDSSVRERWPHESTDRPTAGGNADPRYIGNDVLEHAFQRDAIKTTSSNCADSKQHD